MLGGKSSRYLKRPFPKDHTIVRLARKWFVRRVFRAATVRERSSDCQPIIYREFMQPSTSHNAAGGPAECCDLVLLRPPPQQSTIRRGA